MTPNAETNEDDAAEEWPTPVNWREDPAIKAKRRKNNILFKFCINSYTLSN